MTRRALSILVCCAIGAVSAGAQDKDQNKEQDRLANCGTVMHEILNVPDNVPQEVLDKARCVVVIPSMTKVALVVGGSYGRGAMVCRSGEHFDGSWGAPAMFSLEGGSFGLQLGAQATDIVLMVINDRGAQKLLGSSVKLGGDATAAAGPKGRHVEADTDATMRAEILSYSRSRGLFAGISLDGTSLRPDDDATELVYGRKLTAKEVLEGRDVVVPESGQGLVEALKRHTPATRSDK